ncbi:MAG: hypothetical protein ACM3QS_02695 [Bacteroidota bacterium]
MPKTKIQINRAPVLTLWAAVVAERLGYDRDEALTLAKAVAGLNAQSKGRRLGINEERKEEEEEEKRAPAKKAEKVEFVELLGRGVPALKTPKGLRAAIQGEPIHPESVQRYLEQKFGDDLEAARGAMEKLARAYTPKKLESQAYSLYEKFRPEIPEGKKGWGAKGELDLDHIMSLAG